MKRSDLRKTCTLIEPLCDRAAEIQSADQSGDIE
jgi:hypothetical protein